MSKQKFMTTLEPETIHEIKIQAAKENIKLNHLITKAVHEYISKKINLQKIRLDK